MEIIVTHAVEGFDFEKCLETFRCGRPFNDEYGNRIGTVLRIWREGNVIKADIECVPEDMEKKDTDTGLS